MLRLIGYLSNYIDPTRHLWLAKLSTLMDRYFKNESRTNIRVKALDVLTKVIKINR